MTTKTELFRDWCERQEIDLDKRGWASKASRLLGKSERMVRYYNEGRDIPLDTLMLMEAYDAGYRPRERARM